MCAPTIGNWHGAKVGRGGSLRFTLRSSPRYILQTRNLLRNQLRFEFIFVRSKDIDNDYLSFETDFFNIDFGLNEAGRLLRSSLLLNDFTIALLLDIIVGDKRFLTVIINRKLCVVEEKKWNREC